MPKLRFIAVEKKIVDGKTRIVGKWMYGVYEKMTGGLAFVEKKQGFNFPHQGFKQVEKNKKRNPEGLEFPKGFRVWVKRSA